MKTQAKIIGKDEHNNDVVTIVRKPDRKLLQEGQKIYSQTVRISLAAGYLFKTALEKYLVEQGIWGEEDEKNIAKLRDEIFEKTQYIKTGKKDGNVLKLTEARDIAYEVRVLRRRINEINEKRNSFDLVTVEESASNCQFDFLCSRSFFKEDGSLVFENVEQYNAHSHLDWVQKCAHQLMCFQFGINENWTAELIENKFLIERGFIDPETLMSKELMVELEKIKEEEAKPEQVAQFLDENGQLV